MAEIGRCFSADEYHETDIPGCRSILFTAVLAVGVLFVGLYVFLQFPPVQQAIKTRRNPNFQGLSVEG